MHIPLFLAIKALLFKCQTNSLVIMNTHHINMMRLANAQKSVVVFVGAIDDLSVTAYDDTTITLDWTTPQPTTLLIITRFG